MLTFYDFRSFLYRLRARYRPENTVNNFGVHTWRAVSQFLLTDDFIRKLQHKLDWNFISGSIPLTENFIREFQGKINWDSVSKSQNLSEDFI